MRAALLILSVVLPLVFSQALDFDVGSDRTVGSGFWLDDGEWTVDISGRDDLVSSVIELTLGCSHPGYDCYYSVWLGEDKVSQGTFNNVANNVIPLLTGTIDASVSSTLTVKTEGCVLGRYAVPFSFGDPSGFNRNPNSPSVELVDISPGSAALATYNTQSAAKGATLTIPDNFNDWVNRLTYVRYTDNDCQFSSQACYGAPNEQFWSTSVNEINTDIDFFIPTVSDTSNPLLFELSLWSSGPWFTIIAVCNNSDTTGNCSNSASSSWISVNSASEGSLLYQQGGRIPSASGITQIKYSRTFFEFPDDPNLAPSLRYGTGDPAVIFPYAKVWDLSVTDDPHHQVTKMTLSSNCMADYDYNGWPSCTGGNGFQVYVGGSYLDGTLYLGENWQSTGSYFPDVTSPNVYIPSGQPCTYPQKNWYYCWTSPYPFTAITNITAVLEGLQTTTGSAPGTTTSANITNTIAGAAFTDGFIQLYGIDTGVVTIHYAGDNSWYPTPALSNYHHVSVQTTGGSALAETTSFWDFGLQYPSAQAYLRGLGSVYGGHLEPGLGSGYKVILEAEVGYSMSVFPYIFVHALAPTINITDGTAICDPATTCNGNGVCLNSNCACNPGFTGADCSGLVVFCQTGSCLNGGSCSENPSRTYDDVSKMYINVVTCDCSKTNVTGSTGPFLGTYCEIQPPCDQQPCLNEGTCSVNTETNSWECDCSQTKSPNSTQPYTGLHCEISQARPCDNSPCLNGGICSNNGVGNTAYATCDCAPTGGYIGTFCDLPPIDKCTSTTCGAYGVCYPSSASADGFTRCVCTNGWSGTKCDTEPTVCQDKCLHGGACYSLGALSGSSSKAYSCICTPPWVGMHCQWNESQWNSASSSSVGLFVFFVVGLASLF